MFSQPPEDDQNKTLQSHPRRPVKSYKSKNKRKGKKKNGIKKKQQRHPNFTISTMSSWAENFTHAATWQMKHQIAYWKSKATALEYENRILHDIIRKNYLNIPQNGIKIQSDSGNENITEQVEESESSESGGDEEFEVSEEYIQFLMSNAKYKEEAKLERERLRESQNTDKAEMDKMESMPMKSKEDKEAALKELYGESWQKVAALEMSVQSQFLNACDVEKAEYWPNIPLNFNFG